MVHGKNRIPYWIDRRLNGLAGPDYDATISFGLPFEPEDSQYGKSRLSSLTWALVAFLVVDVITSSGDLYDAISVLGLILFIPVAVTVTAVCTAFVVSLAQQGHAGLNRFGPDPRAMDTLKSTADV